MIAKLTADQVNILNIFLMLASAGLAYLYPFELFLLVYAVLGPLHYLTEISWLHDKNYYTQRKYDYAYLGLASLAITGLSLGYLQGFPGMAGAYLVYAAFVGGLVFLLVRDLFKRLIVLLTAGLVGLVLMKVSFIGLLLTVFFPTLIHVFVFTGLFILAGALKTRSGSGFISLMVFVGTACLFIFFHPNHTHYHASEYVRNSYGFFKEDGVGNNVFIALNYLILKTFGLHDFGPPVQPLAVYVDGINQFLYENPVALSLMSFISFAYTYHYLNWFSKTSIIRWHEVPRVRMGAVVLIWLGSILLYVWDYSIGFRWLFFLSFAHVLLEFPLNHLTMINVGKDLRNLMAGKQRAAG